MVAPALIALALLSGQGPASTGQEQTQPDVVDDVVVRGVSGDPIGRFVGGLTMAGKQGRFLGQVARWGANLCVSVSGGVPEVNAYLVEQITANFASLDVPHAAPGCEPTVSVVISREADRFAEVYAREARNRFFDNRRQVIAEFIGPNRPVRWRHVTRSGFVGPDPRQSVLAEGFDDLPGRLPNSRLVRSTARAVEGAIIVVDADRAAPAPLDALAAYLAFVALVDMPAEPETGGQRTILSLFDEDPPAGRPRGLTRWDRAFIEALYGMTMGRSFGFQQSEIETRMRRALEVPPSRP